MFTVSAVPAVPVSKKVWRFPLPPEREDYKRAAIAEQDRDIPLM